MRKFILLTGVAVLALSASESWAVLMDCSWNGTKLTVSGTGTFTGCSNSSNHRNATEVVFGSEVTSIGSSSFSYATNLRSITIPDSVTSIGNLAFNGASSLTSINFGKNSQLTSIGQSAFDGATNLGSVTIPDSVTSIGAYAFANSGLRSITIPDSVTSIGNWAFSGATRLKEIIIPDSWADDNITLDDAIFQGSCLRGNVCVNAQNPKIVCQGILTKCQTALAKFIANEDGTCDAGNSIRCITDIDLIISATEERQCTGVGYIWDNNTCRRKTESECSTHNDYYYSGGKCQILPKTKTACESAELIWNNTSLECSKITKSFCTNQGQVFWKNKCMDEYPFARKHWTPAEANEYLYDDNNTITITFKK